MILIHIFAGMSPHHTKIVCCSIFIFIPHMLTPCVCEHKLQRVGTCTTVHTTLMRSACHWLVSCTLHNSQHTQQPLSMRAGASHCVRGTCVSSIAAATGLSRQGPSFWKSLNTQLLSALACVDNHNMRNILNGWQHAICECHARGLGFNCCALVVFSFTVQPCVKHVFAIFMMGQVLYERIAGARLCERISTHARCIC